MALLDDLPPQPDRQATIPHPSRSKLDRVLAIRNELTARRVPNQPFFDRTLKAEIEVVKRSNARKMRDLEPHPHAFTPLRFDMDAENLVEKLKLCPIVTGRFGQKRRRNIPQVDLNVRRTNPRPRQRSSFRPPGENAEETGAILCEPPAGHSGWTYSS